MEFHLGPKAVSIIRGEPERALNTRVTYSKFAVPMYVCMHVCSDTCLSRMSACSIDRPVKIVITVQYSTQVIVSVVYILFRWSIVEVNTKCTCSVKREEKVRSQPVFKYGTRQAMKTVL